MSSIAPEKGEHLRHKFEGSNPDIRAGLIIDLVDGEVFSESAEVDFRTVTWHRATIIFLKIIFATGILSIPIAMSSLGAVGGTFSIIGWGLLNTYTGLIQGEFRLNHPSCHSIADMAGAVGGPIAQEITRVLFIFAYLIATGSGIVGASIGLDTLSGQAACTVWWSFLATVIIAAAASVRKFQHIGWLTWVGFISIFVAVFIVAVAVTTRDRPAVAPAVGAFLSGISSPAFSCSYFRGRHDRFVYDLCVICRDQCLPSSS
ncbi:Amino acid transportertransmembrane [Penicillium sp. IBT 31633x]|nr:Amino acid transportertransmembrane [Penicillium sp. IBT 31633x]